MLNKVNKWIYSNSKIPSAKSMTESDKYNYLNQISNEWKRMLKLSVFGGGFISLFTILF